MCCPWNRCLPQMENFDGNCRKRIGEVDNMTMCTSRDQHVKFRASFVKRLPIYM